MKKCFYVLISLLLITFSSNVFACGEITDVTTSVGTIRQTKKMYYVITVPEGTTKVTIGAKSDSPFVEGSGPREVPTSSQARIRVDGNNCGKGITSYFFSFEVEKKVTPVPEPTPQPNPNENPSVTPEPPVDTKPYLKDLKIENIDFNFDKKQFEYNLEVKEEITSITILPEVEDDKSTYEILGQYENLEFGNNKIEIVLKNDKDQTSSYVINVVRKRNLSNNNYLSDVKINNYVINFDSSISSYDLTIQKEKILSIIVVPENEKATYEILGNNGLNDGSKIIIRVTAEDGSERDYIINIFKKEDKINMYIVYGGIALALVLIILLIVIIINKNKRKKQNNQINEVSIPTNNNLFVNNMQTDTTMDANPFVLNQNVQIQEHPNNVVNPNAQNVGLQFVNPSYLENIHVDENTSNTEIFKL